MYVPAFTDEEMRQILKEQMALDDHQNTQCILLTEGNVNQALKLAQRLEPPYFVLFQTWMRLCYTRDLTQLVEQADIFHQKPKIEQMHFLTYGLHLLRETMVGHFVPATLARVTEPEQLFTRRLRKTVTHGQLRDWVSSLNQAHDCLARNVSAKIMHLDLSLRIAQSFRGKVTM